MPCLIVHLELRRETEEGSSAAVLELLQQEATFPLLTPSPIATVRMGTVSPPSQPTNKHLSSTEPGCLGWGGEGAKLLPMSLFTSHDLPVLWSMLSILDAESLVFVQIPIIDTERL